MIYIRRHSLIELREQVEQERMLDLATARWEKMMADHPGLKERYDNAIRKLSEKHLTGSAG